MSGRPGKPTSQAVLELQRVSHRFQKPLDVAAKALRCLGAPVSAEVVHAVDGVDLAVGKATIAGLVGESGCGKSTLGKIAAGLIQPTDGSVLFEGSPAAAGGATTALAVQMIFQNPYSSLNPRMRVLDIVSEAPLYHKLIGPREVRRLAVESLQRVGLDSSCLSRYPHQLSGGQQQRLGIARALAVNPGVVVCDEAVAALDASIQAQIMNLFLELREKLQISFLFISHDLRVVEYLSDHVFIMYLGRIVEEGPTDTVFADPSHPYTKALIREIPKLHGGPRRFAPIAGEIPSPLSPPTGCHFHPRCRLAMDKCRRVAPELKELDPGRYAACHLNE